MNHWWKLQSGLPLMRKASTTPGKTSIALTARVEYITGKVPLLLRQLVHPDFIGKLYGKIEKFFLSSPQLVTVVRNAAKHVDDMRSRYINDNISWKKLVAMWIGTHNLRWSVLMLTNSCL
jgi:hypothetical protein